MSNPQPPFSLDRHVARDEPLKLDITYSPTSKPRHKIGDPVALIGEGKAFEN